MYRKYTKELLRLMYFELKFICRCSIIFTMKNLNKVLFKEYLLVGGGGGVKTEYSKISDLIRVVQ